jgi:hypothetical protein
VDCRANRHDKALRQWRRWRRARFGRERDEALFELWQLCKPEVWAAVKRLATKLSENRGSPGSISVPVWLAMHGMDEEEVRHIAYPGVWRAAQVFDPAKGTFQTYAFYPILREICRHVRAVGTLADKEARDTEVPDRVERDLLRDRLLLLAHALSPGTRFEHVLQRTASLPSEYLDALLEDFERLCPEQVWSANPPLETVRSALLSQAVRAADSEGKMVPVSDLAKMLRAKEYRQQMKKQYRSNSRLAREFGVSDQTVGRWLAAAGEQGVGADDLSLEALDRLARIMAPRRGPRAGRKPSTPKS